MAARTKPEQSVSSPSTTSPSAFKFNPWRIVGGIFMISAIVLYAIYVVMGFQFRTQPFPGYFLTHTGTVNAGAPVGEITWTGLDAGIQRNDFVIAVNGVALSETDNTDLYLMRQNHDLAIRSLSIGDTVTIDVLRQVSTSYIDTPNCEVSGDVALCQFTFDIMPFNTSDFSAFFLLPALAGFFIIFLSIAVWQFRGDNLVGFLATLIGFTSIIFVSGIFDAGTTNQLTIIWLIAASSLGGLLVAFGFVFPTSIPAIQKYPIFIALPIVLSVTVSIPAFVQYLNPSSAWVNGSSQFTTMVSVIGLIILFLLVWFYHRPRSITPDKRDQNNTLIIGTALMIVAALVWFGNRAILTANSSALSINFEALMPLYIFPNIAIAYAVLQYRRFDTDRIISQGITYFIMVLALVISNFMLVLGLNFILQDAINANDPLLNASLLFGMVALFIPVRIRLQRRIDKIYFRARRNYQQDVEQFSQKLTNLNRYSAISLEFRQTLNNSVNPASLFIYTATSDQSTYRAYNDARQETDIEFAPDSDLIQYLRENTDNVITLSNYEPWPPELRTEATRLSILRANIIVPMPGTEFMNGFVIVGPPLSGKSQYEFEEVRFVMNLVGQLSIATERAQVIDSLERRVTELNVLSQVGQAVNFTIEFDVLLELIYTQTSRLIDASHFYITLHEESIEQVYFAFFLQNDDRITDRENVRWAIGNDIMSYIINSGRALKLDDFVTDGQSYDLDLFDKEIASWMGVPLTAGRSTIGAIAVAKTRIGEAYTPEQFKIFNDIGALASTSIEKARLFNATRLRERQLTVLNDISQQLVATESDVEKLLEIITASAVEILNAEAGSLLLATDDFTDELEFRVVIGGAGSDLVGSRWDSKKGVVGKVMTTGEAQIVNDAEQDSRHTEDTKGEKSIQQYHTSSLLAVPLIAKEEIIGVLEVLNKTDGTPFIQEDVDLLTTFGGQAAIAIENARLFQMTDIQLTQRVSELETLESFDTKLNRTLDLSEVAKITVTSAMQTLNAEAGALGIVHLDPPYLEIVSISGYVEDDYPEEADGYIWPLDEGIIGRVIRNRQPDLASDVSIDPDYTKGLRGSLSQITLPMLSGQDINALLILETNQDPSFTLTDWLFAQRLAEHASIAVANAQLYQELTRANKSKSEFMGFAAHELKNPLSSVKGYSDLMLKGMIGELNEQQQSFVNVIYSNANRMETIINDLRDSAKMDANEFAVELSPIHIHHAVIETLRPFTHVLQEKSQTLVNDVSEDLPMVMADQTRIIQVLTNLFSNAHKYSPEDTSITLFAETVKDFVNGDGVKRGDVLKLGVKDEGLGMSQEDQNRLFKERYFRSTNPDALDQPGTGLGMMLTFGIMQKHQGDIWIESELGSGATFYITLPLAPQDQQTLSFELGSD